MSVRKPRKRNMSLIELASWFLDNATECPAPPYIKDILGPCLCVDWLVAEAYGHVRTCHKGKRVWAHRIVYEVFIGPAGDLIVCHKCDVPSCINPDHLFLGTHDDNQKDKANKGRSRDQYGESNNQAKITEEDVIKIRKLYATGMYTQQEIADEFPISHVNVSRVVNRKRWAHI